MSSEWCAQKMLRCSQCEKMRAATKLETSIVGKKKKKKTEQTRQIDLCEKTNNSSSFS